jgi:hypothetical protein
MATSRAWGVRVAVVAMVLLAAGQAQAQELTTWPPTVNFREALSKLDYRTMVVAPHTAPPAPQAPPAPRKRSQGRQTLGAVLGAAAGFFAGGFIGYTIDRQGRNPDNFTGVLVGAPIGALTGAILGAKSF